MSRVTADSTFPGNGCFLATGDVGRDLTIDCTGKDGKDCPEAFRVLPGSVGVRALLQRVRKADGIEESWSCSSFIES